MSKENIMRWTERFDEEENKIIAERDAGFLMEAENIYHRYVQYEWNDVSDSLKKSIIAAIYVALTVKPPQP